MSGEEDPGGTSPAEWERQISADLASLQSAHLYRSRTVVHALDAVHVEIDGRRYVNFSSNNYLGLTHHPKVLRAGAQALEAAGAGSGAAPLISGYTSYHAATERALAAWKGTEQAVLLPSGYQANHAAVQTLAAVAQRAAGVRFLIDKLSHASLIDSVRATGAPFRVFPHNSLAKLERLLSDAPAGEFQVVVTESIFSMDGSSADLAGLAEMRQRYGFLLLLDEAHGSGVYGPAGEGWAAEAGFPKLAEVTVVTLSKAMGGIGGAVCGSSAFCNALINHGRAFIFSTSLAPAAAATAGAAIEVIRDEPARRSRVRDLAKRVRAPIDLEGDVPIVPVLLESERAALDAAAALREAGMLVVAIRPPTVPRGTSRLRITLSCDHTDDEVEKLLGALTVLKDTQRSSGISLGK